MEWLKPAGEDESVFDRVISRSLLSMYEGCGRSTD